MFRIGEAPAGIDAETKALAGRVDTGIVGHLREKGIVHRLRPTTSSRAFVGTAFTVRLPDIDATAIHYAVDRLEAGNVLVVDMGGDQRRASVGGTLAFIAEQRGASGIIVDGMATDLVDLEHLTIPVWSRGISAMTTRVLGIEGDVNVPVVIDDVVVTPGDVVIADADGIVFVPPTELAALAEAAIAMKDGESRFMQMIIDGTGISEISHAAEHVAKGLVRFP